MKLTILGSAGGFPGAANPTSGYLLTIDGRNILIDCGSGVLSNLFQLIRVQDLDAVILTHLHHDHICDLPVLKYAIDLSRKNGIACASLPVYLPEEPARTAKAIREGEELVAESIPEDLKLSLFGAKITFYPMQHPVATFGLTVEYADKKLALTSDTVDCPNLTPLLAKADLALMDAGSIEALRQPQMMHLTAAECGRIARENNVRRLVLTHMLPLIDRRDILAEAKQEFVTAELALPLVEFFV